MSILNQNKFFLRFKSLCKVAVMDETSYLLSSPKNAARLLKATQDYNVGIAKKRQLIEK